jgi:hypothetical protein
MRISPGYLLIVPFSFVLLALGCQSETSSIPWNTDAAVDAQTTDAKDAVADVGDVEPEDVENGDGDAVDRACDEPSRVDASDNVTEVAPWPTPQGKVGRTNRALTPGPTELNKLWSIDLEKDEDGFVVGRRNLYSFRVIERDEDSNAVDYTNETELLARDKATGEVMWRVGSPGPCSPPAALPNGGVAIMSDDRVAAYDASGELRWSAEANPRCDEQIAPVEGGKIVFSEWTLNEFGGQAARFRVMDTENGEFVGGDGTLSQTFSPSNRQFTYTSEREAFHVESERHSSDPDHTLHRWSPESERELFDIFDDLTWADEQELPEQADLLEPAVGEQFVSIWGHWFFGNRCYYFFRVPLDPDQAEPLMRRASQFGGRCSKVSFVRPSLNGGLVGSFNRLDIVRFEENSQEKAVVFVLPEDRAVYGQRLTTGSGGRIYFMAGGRPSESNWLYHGPYTVMSMPDVPGNSTVSSACVADAIDDFFYGDVAIEALGEKRVYTRVIQDESPGTLKVYGDD